MALFFCQVRGMLPALPPKSLEAVRRCREEVTVAVAPDGCANAEAAAQMLFDFFTFYATVFPWGTAAVSTRAARALERPGPPDRGAGSPSVQRRTVGMLMIEDPVEFGVDLAAPYLSPKRDLRLRAEFRRARRLLIGPSRRALDSTHGSSWDMVFRPR